MCMYFLLFSIYPCVLVGTTTAMVSMCKGDSALLPHLVSIATRETATICVYDDSHDDISSMVTSMLGGNRPLLMYEYKSFYSFLDHYMREVLENLPSATEYRSHLHFMLLCGIKNTRNLMSYVIELDGTIGQGSLLRHFSTWLIFSPDLLPLLDMSLDNVAMIKISQVPLMTPSTSTYRNITFDTVGNSSNCLHIDVYTLMWTTEGRAWSRVYIYNLPHDQMYDLLFPNTKNGLNGRQLRLATLEWRPYTQRIVIQDKVTYVGAGVDLIDMFSWKLNFSYVIVEPEDMLWGQELKNGSYTGILGMFKRAETHICPVPYGITFGRKKVMDFTYPITASVYSLVYRRRTDTTQTWLYHISCFSWEVYIWGLIPLVWVVLILGYLHKQTKTKKTNPHSICFEAAINVPLHQALLMVPSSISTRVLICTWCLFCLVMSSVYTGNLVAFATVDKHKAPFNTLQELVEQNEYEVGLLEGSYAENILMTSEDPLLKSLYKKVVQGDNYSTPDVLRNINRVLDEKYVLMAATPVKKIIRSLTCDIVEMKENLFPLHSGFAFPRYSPLKHLFDEKYDVLLTTVANRHRNVTPKCEIVKKVLQIRELGVMTRLESKWTPKPLDCDSPLRDHQFQLDNLKTVLITCLACVMVAGIVLVLERWKVK